MMLRGWAIDRFGHLRSSAGAGIGDHLTVIWAPNETGKSTLHHFIRWTLLGYPGNTLPMRRYRGAPHSGAIGGRLLVEHGGQSLVLARDSKTKVSRITTSSGAESGFSQSDLTGTITLPAYEAVFGIGLDDLQSADALGQDTVREQIFAAGTVGGGRSAAEALKDIEARLKHLTRRSTGFIATARRDLDGAVADLATVRHRSEHLPALQSELDRLEAEGRAATEELSELDRQRDRLARLRRVWPTWSPAMAAARDLAELADLDLGLDPLGHLENELDRRQSLQSLVGATRTQLSRLTQESERLADDPALCAVLPRAEAALASAGVEAQRREDLRERSDSVARRQRHLDEQLSQLGPGWTVESVAAVDTSFPVHQRLLDGTRAVVGAAARLDEVQLRAALSTHAVEQADRRLLDLDQPSTSSTSPPRRRVRASEPLPRVTAAVCIVGFVAALAGVVTGRPVAAVAGTLVCALGIAISAALGRGSAGSGTATDAGATMPDQALRARLSVEQQHVHRDLVADLAATDEAERAAQAADASFRELLRAIGLPDDLNGDAAIAFLRSVASLRTDLLALAEDRVDIAGAAASLESGVDQQLDVLSLVGAPVGDLRALEPRRQALQDLVERAQTAVDARRRRAQLSEQIENLQMTLAATEASAQDAEAALAARFAAASATDELSFRRSVATAERRAGLLTLVADAERIIEAQFGDAADDARKELNLGRIDDWTTLLQNLEARRPALEASVEQQHRDEAAVAVRLQAIAESADVVTASMEVDRLTADLTAAGEEWAHLTIAHRAIAATLHEFELERQPEVVQFASRAFERVTEGRWTTITAANGSIEVLDSSGDRLSDNQLSRGATEQLYLCMRLGLATSHARHHVPLPLLLDDVMVNADAGRQVRIADELAAVAEGLQVVVFTAHRSTVERLRQARSDTAIIELS